MFEFGPYTFDPAAGTLHRDGALVQLSPRTLDLLGVLLARRGELVTFRQLRTAVWPGRKVADTEIGFYITILRDALGDALATTWIEIVDTRGYRFVDAVREGPAQPAATREPVPAPAPEPVPVPAPVPDPTASRSPGPLVLAGVGVLIVVGLGYVAWQLFRGPSAPATEVVSVAAPIRSVLVVQFHVTPQDPAHAYLGAAMADAVQLRLRPILQARVARAVAPVPGEDAQHLATRLGVETVITGSIEHMGTTLHLTAEVVRASDGQRLSAMTASADASQLFSLQDQAATHIALALQPGLTEPERAALARQESTSAEAYTLFIQAQEQWRRRSRESVAAAIDGYAAAVRLDPGFVRAHAGLAAAYATLDTRSDPLVHAPRAASAAERAVAIDAASAHAHTALGLVRYRFEWRWADAAAEFATALTLAPRDAFTRHQHGVFLQATGRADAALSELALALALEPDSPAIRADMVAPLLRASRTADARAMVDAVQVIDPGWPTLDQLHADVCAAEGRVDEHVASLWRALLARGVLPGRVDALRAAYRAGGLTTMLERRATQLARDVEAGPSPPLSYFLATDLALTHAALKHRDQTMYWLAVAIDLREDAPLHMRASAAFDFVRADPHFTELLRRAKIE